MNHIEPPAFLQWTDGSSSSSGIWMLSDSLQMMGLNPFRSVAHRQGYSLSRLLQHKLNAAGDCLCRCIDTIRAAVGLYLRCDNDLFLTNTSNQSNTNRPLVNEETANKSSGSTSVRAMVVILVAIILTQTPARADLVLVKGGLPNSVILLPDKATAVTQKAAWELQHYLQEISGAEIPIYNEREFALGDYQWLMTRQGGVISIGPTRLAHDAGLNVGGLGPEGYLIETRGNTLFILGREDPVDTTSLRSSRWQSFNWPIERRGTLYGVYALLEEHLGVRWLWPGDLGEVYPSQKDIVLPEISQQSAPVLSIRKMRPALLVGDFKNNALKLGESPESMLRRAVETDRWVERMRMGESNVIDQTHFYGQPFWDKYHASHPQWFALQPNGERMGTPEVPGRVRLCYSNKALRAEVARMVIEKIKSNPDITSVGVGLDDVSPESFCQCEECQAYGPTLSDRVARYNSDIARLVTEAYPDKYITMFAYASWREAPRQVRVHPNVIISYVGVYTGGYLYAPDRRENRALWGRWQQHTGGKLLWRPNLPETLGIPVVWVDQAAEDLRQFAPDLWGADIDSLHGSWATEGLNHYVLAKLLWNPQQDVDALIRDYCDLGFGEAAEPVHDYFTNLQSITRQIADRAPGHGYDQFCKYAPNVLTNNRLHTLRSLLRRAKALASKDPDPKVVQRVEFLQEGLEWATLSMSAWAGYAKADTSASTRQAVTRMYTWLEKHADSYAIYGGRTGAKMGWMWQGLFENTKQQDWSRPF